MLTNLQQIFEEYWDEYVQDCYDWQRTQLHPSLKDFALWLEERDINTDLIEPVRESVWEDVGRNR